MAGLSNSSPYIDSIVSDILPFSNRHTTRSVIAKLVVAATAYFIWQKRNYRLFKKVKRSENQLVECIISSVRFKLMTCRFKKSRDGLAILRQWKLSEMLRDWPVNLLLEVQAQLENTMMQHELQELRHRVTILEWEGSRRGQ
ncbi:hypothetical protein Tco_1293045 [Tanacetum coccineum]